jgi:DNA-binding NarL/FixJ family response regulator
VALVVGRGAMNREAAAQLFLSPKTVENHLRHIFEKLGIRTGEDGSDARTRIGTRRADSES